MKMIKLNSKYITGPVRIRLDQINSYYFDKICDDGYTVTIRLNGVDSQAGVYVEGSKSCMEGSAELEPESYSTGILTKEEAEELISKLDNLFEIIEL